MKKFIAGILLLLCLTSCQKHDSKYYYEKYFGDYQYDYYFTQSEGCNFYIGDDETFTIPNRDLYKMKSIMGEPYTFNEDGTITINYCKHKLTLDHKVYIGGRIDHIDN